MTPSPGAGGRRTDHGCRLDGGQAEVAARVAWSGVGINLETARPNGEAVKDAYRRIFADDTFRSRAREMAMQFKQFDSAAIIQESLRSVAECSEDEAVKRWASWTIIVIREQIQRIVPKTLRWILLY